MIRTFWPLVLIQLRDKLDFSWTKSAKGIIQKIAFTILSFLIVGGIAFAAMFLMVSTFLLFKGDVIDIILVFLTFFGLLNVISISFSLTKSLYCAEDNKFLATMPVGAGMLFFSKLTVFTIFQIKRDFALLVPVTLGLFAYGVSVGLFAPWMVVWCLIPLFLFSLISIMLGAFLSIPMLYVYQAFRNFPILEVALFLILVPAIVVGLIYGISQLPNSIDLFDVWLPIRANIVAWIKSFRGSFSPMDYVTIAMHGEVNTAQVYALTGKSFLATGIMLAVALLLGVLVYILIKPFYFWMMSKTFELKKGATGRRKNGKPMKQGTSVFLKEMRLSIRDFGISGTFIAVYLLAPVMFYFVDRVFGAIATSLAGDAMVIGFNLFLMLVPYLVSNSVVATLRSRQGNSVYMDKTHPIESTTPILARGAFQMILSVPSIAVEAYIFYQYSGMQAWGCVTLGVAVLLIQLGHIFHALAMDFMNPQNELYDMDGESKPNPNEFKTAATGFVIALVFGLLGVGFFIECTNHAWGYDSMWIRLVLIAVAFFVAQAMLFVWKVRAYYKEK